MKTYTIKTYLFSELSKEAQENAYIRDRHNIDGEYYNADFRATLAEFEKLFDITVKHYEVDSQRYTFDFYFLPDRSDYDHADGINDPLRLAVYVWNNYADRLKKGKLYSTSGRYENGRYIYKHRHSKIFLNMDECPLTGCFCDCDILQPVLDCLQYRAFYRYIDDLLTDCLNRFFETWRDCLEYTETFDFYEGEAEANEWEYYEDGTKFTLQRLVKA